MSAAVNRKILVRFKLVHASLSSSVSSSSSRDAIH